MRMKRYADELPGASRFADDAVRHVDRSLNSSNSLLGVERASSELLEAVSKD